MFVNVPGSLLAAGSAPLTLSATAGWAPVAVLVVGFCLAGAAAAVLVAAWRDRREAGARDTRTKRRPRLMAVRAA